MPKPHVIRAWRAKNELSLRKLAGKAGISIGNLSDMETRKGKSPTVKTVLALSRATGIPPSDILKEHQ